LIVFKIGLMNPRQGCNQEGHRDSELLRAIFPAPRMFTERDANRTPSEFRLFRNPQPVQGVPKEHKQ
jgi:hypothetical protein